MKIIDVFFVAGHAAFYFDDQQAIKQGAKQDGFIYTGKAVTDGFSAIRQPGECVSILLILDNGQTAKGDCVAVQYSGAAGRDPLFSSKSVIPFLEQHIKPLLLDRDVSLFVSNSKYFDKLKILNRPLHTAIRYGVSQALLDASAIANQCLKAEIICKEYSLPIIAKSVPLFGQSGDDRYAAVDKMILKQVDSLPHALINNVEEKLGSHGEKLIDYVQWLSQRILEVRSSETYFPDLHIDVYGTLGIIFKDNYFDIAQYIHHLQSLAKPFQLYIEGPVDAGSRDGQVEALKKIKTYLDVLNSSAKIVADEWCNTYADIEVFAYAHCCHMVQIKTPDLGCIHNVVEAVLFCQKNGIEAYQGGTCNETDISAQTCVHLALAARPERMLIKPGMGFDEGMTMVNNEMQRSVAQLAHREKKARKIEIDDWVAS
ncbi:MAG: methylaspartate ammonia-lyase [Kiritimatiellia bacterium]